ncbi:PH domain-containing protein [Cellulosimicrobium cellulans]|uniref:PH domain-containing protein n=1 Tax=Cellulosimicrobium cellulans TaxID=1710 RepID=UPI00084949D7|nr:PH domain-containing protein [Cellulosimicrobium cellulans]
MAAARGRPRSRILDRYVLSGERVVVATRHHWGMLLEPVASTIAGLLVVVWLVAQVGPAAGDGVLVLGLLWLLLAARLAWKVFEWRNEWFVATDKRLLLLYGLITHKVAMMPLTKVTDMNYGRSPVGRVLGYGQFLLESAGQDQALRQIDWVAQPEATYRQICDTLFGPTGVASRPRGVAAPPAPDVPTFGELHPVPAPPVLEPPPWDEPVLDPAPPMPRPPVPRPPVPPPPAPPPPVPPAPGAADGPTQPLPVVGHDDPDGERGWAVSDEERAPYVRVTPTPASASVRRPDEPGRGRDGAS